MVVATGDGQNIVCKIIIFRIGKKYERKPGIYLIYISNTINIEET